MSATRDQSQKVTFVYSNFYQLYQKAKKASNGSVLKTSEMNSPHFSQVKIRPYAPVEFLQKRVKQDTKNPANVALEGLRTNLKTLDGLQKRLNFLLKEIEEYSKN